MYLGSADLMPRNLDRRVEILFPVLDPGIVRRLRDGLLAKCLADNRKSRTARPDGIYEFLPVNGAGSVDSQAWFIRHRARAAD
jgi:polyphosphate kinase